jgi:hypothetical protein
MNVLVSVLVTVVNVNTRIRNEYVFNFQYSDTFSSNIIDKFTEINEEKLHASQLIMGR